ncbi:probable L-type lectin-domain containing receptor kinase S.5 [Ziziphus jujuba]|uniref:non-specific serine/threonine protein kinase n=1 Tax=Ziziphus jujuba TaxID=326968 RepID=A0A6P3Z9A8_ZIZJJ|nr:probable L-type lectin-domain containing receptor kinase S.5 [Ziziphus jujuba]
MVTMHFSLLLKQILLIALWCSAFFADQVGCLSFSYPKFETKNEDDFIRSHSYLVQGAIQVTADVRGGDITNLSGRAMYKKPFKLWRKGKGDHPTIASFNSTFVLRITPDPNPGEGLAFILTENTTLPENSDGKWLGIVNQNTNGSSHAKIVAVEFDTRKSYEEDIDNNHVGLDVNSINSEKQVRLINHGVNVSTGTDITVKVEYDGKNISVFFPVSNETERKMKNPVLTMAVNLSDFLPEKTFVGFSASTGNTHTQLNCIRSWDFYSSDIGENPNLLWVWITVPGIVALLGGVLVFYMYWTRKHDSEDLEDSYPRIEEQIQGYSMAPKKFRLKDLRRATDKFDPKNKLGNGGFGTVYKGVLGNKEIAVKRVSKDSSQGKQEFISEVTTIGSLRHKNLVKLIGWCFESHELLIVYEYMPNGSLDKLIFSDDQKLGIPIAESKVLSWERRQSVIHGVAQALDYLHNGCEKRVLHRDIKSSNIMLDSDFNAKLGDFGLARTIHQSEKSHHSTKEIAGTLGYMAPESFLIGRATVETDVYAFGVLVLEVICGRKPGNQYEQNNYNNSIVHCLWELYSKGKIHDAVDLRLKEYDEEEMVRVLILGLACCHPNPHERPSMRAVLKVLIGEADPPLVSTDIPTFMWPPMPSFPNYSETSMQTRFTQLTGR